METYINTYPPSFECLEFSLLRTLVQVQSFARHALQTVLGGHRLTHTWYVIVTSYLIGLYVAGPGDTFYSRALKPGGGAHHPMR
jgi:hypothetical protein